MAIVKTLTLTSEQQLVDLNEDMTNFDLTYEIRSKGMVPFKALVVDQTTLDNNPDIDFMTVDKGILSGNILADKNVYQNYFLCLKNDRQVPCQLEITIEKREIPPNTQESSNSQRSVRENFFVSSETGEWNWLYITIAVVVLLLVVGGVYYYFRTPSNPTTSFVEDTQSDGGQNFYNYIRDKNVYNIPDNVTSGTSSSSYSEEF